MCSTAPRQWNYCRNEALGFAAQFSPEMTALTIVSLRQGLNPHLTKSRLNDAPRLSRCCANGEISARHGEEQAEPSWVFGGSIRVEWLGLTKAVSAGRSRKQSSRKASRSLLGGAAITCVVLGCGWTVYANILSASVYPTISGAGYGEPVVKQGRDEPTRDVT